MEINQELADELVAKYGDRPTLHDEACEVLRRFGIDPTSISEDMWSKANRKERQKLQEMARKNNEDPSSPHHITINGDSCITNERKSMEIAEVDARKLLAEMGSKTSLRPEVTVRKLASRLNDLPELAAKDGLAPPENEEMTALFKRLSAAVSEGDKVVVVPTETSSVEYESKPTSKKKEKATPPADVETEGEATKADPEPSKESEEVKTAMKKVTKKMVMKVKERGQELAKIAAEVWISPPIGTGSNAQRIRHQGSLSDLIQAGLLHKGDKLFMKWRQMKFEGTISPNGEIEVQGKSFPIASNAAIFALQAAGSGRTTANGWIEWKTASGASLADLRKQWLTISKK